MKQKEKIKERISEYLGYNKNQDHKSGNRPSFQYARSLPQ